MCGTKAVLLFPLWGGDPDIQGKSVVTKIQCKSRSHKGLLVVRKILPCNDVDFWRRPRSQDSTSFVALKLAVYFALHYHGS
mmetsp:Transcript_24857/g.34066  ORF Transcript_24857/g.34066 Transcript_24857/m.34066 type:complete len:81 (-) Transcript_24857:175-417(-)